MLKKMLGGFSLLIFVLTFIMPLLIIPNTANSTDNRVDFYLYRIRLVCADGQVIGSYDEWRSVSWTDESTHPGDYCHWVEFCYSVWKDGRWQEECEDIWVCDHRDHNITYRLYDTPTYVDKPMSERACR